MSRKGVWDTETRNGRNGVSDVVNEWRLETKDEIWIVFTSLSLSLSKLNLLFHKMFRIYFGSEL